MHRIETSAKKTYFHKGAKVPHGATASKVQFRLVQAEGMAPDRGED